MIVQEPVQAAIWHCLNHYDYPDAVFLSERLYAEVKTEDSLFLLATAYYRSGQVDQAYHILKDKGAKSPQCRFLLGNCAYEMQKYAEAESVLTENVQPTNNSFDDILLDYEEQAAFVLLLLAKISSKTERKQLALEAYEMAMKLNPFLWSCFENMCLMGEKPSAIQCFQLRDINIINNQTNNSDSAQSINSTPQILSTPQQILGSYPTCNSLNSPRNVFTPDESPMAIPLCMSGFGLLTSSRNKQGGRFRMMDSIEASPDPSPTFGYLRGEEYSSTPSLQPTLTEANEQKSFSKKVRAHVGNLINRKEAILQNNKPVFSLTSNVNNAIPVTQTTPAQGTPGQNVRRSSRLFTNNYSVKENNKSPNRNKFVTPKSPSRKTKQRLAKCGLNDFNNYMDLNTKNRLKKEKSATVTSIEAKQYSSVTKLQKESAEGLLYLLRDIGEAYEELVQFNLAQAIDKLSDLPPNQLETAWVYCMLGLAYFEMSDYENCVRYFSEVHTREPNRIKYMDIYSTALWHLQKEVALSALAQDLMQINKNSPVTWIVSGNCFSLHKEHDMAIKFLHRAVQVDPTLPYAYTLLGHEYIMTEELDKALSCYRSAVRLDPRHYNAWFGMGTIYSKQERFHLAEIHYHRALMINPQSSVILCHIGVVQHALKKTDRAINTLNLAIGNNPKDALCKFHRGQIYFALGRHSEALRELEELKQIVPKESLVYYLIGKVHKKLGNTDLAIMHFSWATDLDPKGASSQIKEGFDTSIGRHTSVESPFPPSDSNSVQEGIAFGGIQDDSDDSL